MQALAEALGDVTQWCHSSGQSEPVGARARRGGGRQWRHPLDPLRKKWPRPSETARRGDGHPRRHLVGPLRHRLCRLTRWPGDATKNPPSVAPRHCHRTSGASIALGGGSGPGGESARPLCSRHFPQADTTAPVSGCVEVDTQAPGKGWVVSPPQAVRCRDRGPHLNKGGGWHMKP